MSENAKNGRPKPAANIGKKFGSTRTRANVPVTIRRNIEDFQDPYILEESPPENTLCKRCGDVYTDGRWYPSDQMHGKKLTGEKHEALCPACRKVQDQVPGGVLTLGGNFLWAHKDEIMNLISNEAKKVRDINPLERIMGMEETKENELVITTTNDKLVQRIGKAISKAYSGHIEIKWSEDNKSARVNWFRKE